MTFSRSSIVIHLLAVLSGCNEASPACEKDQEYPDQHDEDLSCFLQPRTSFLDLTRASESGGSACADLTNHGSHSTVDIEVGTPGQKFSVIADTGSDSLIIPSCVCQERGSCSKADGRCFTGTNRSTSFSLKKGPNGALEDMFITFGSGTVEAVVAKEKVSVGHLSVDMKDGLLLMVARKLKLSGQFEGILGLGLPRKMHPKLHAHTAKAPVNAGDLVNKIIKRIFGGRSNSGRRQMVGSVVKTGQDRDANGGLENLPLDSPTRPSGLPQHGAMEDFGPMVSPKSLLEQAGIKRFSMCFNDGANGVLRLGTPEMKQPLGSIGSYHWGLDFRGVSIGSASVPLSFCSPSKMAQGQKTPCGAIPDSGTTLIMAPQEHLSILTESICDGWDRCAKNYSATVKAWPVTKAAVLELLLLDCGSWLTKSKGLNEMPPLNFHVVGSSGNKQTLKLPGWSYVFETTLASAKANKKQMGAGASLMEENESDSSQSRKVCQLAFGATAYNTPENGPVWILGTPLFYEFHVGYDLGSSPPSVSFASTETSPCITCGKEASLVTSTNEEGRQPRWISGPMRTPDIDTDLPL